jgi:hypothetical protein
MYLVYDELKEPVNPHKLKVQMKRTATTNSGVWVGWVRTVKSLAPRHEQPPKLPPHNVSRQTARASNFSQFPIFNLAPNQLNHISLVNQRLTASIPPFFLLLSFPLLVAILAAPGLKFAI